MVVDILFRKTGQSQEKILITLKIIRAANSFTDFRVVAERSGLRLVKRQVDSSIRGTLKLLGLFKRIHD